MTAHVLSQYGHPLAKTPHLDALATSGTVFTNAYCNFPLCAPSRASMLAGRYANALQVWDNATEMSATTPTIAHYLRDRGYHTVLCGKMHFIGPDQLHGFDERIVTDIYPSNFAWTPDWIVGERYRPTGINMRAVVDSGQCVRSLQIDYDDEVTHAGVQKLYDLARFHQHAPFLLWVSFTHPHSPYITTRKYWDLYLPDEVPPPRVPPLELEAMDTMSRWLHYAHGGDLHEVTPQHVQTARHAYLGMCSYIDDQVGRLLTVLDETGLTDNTALIFTSDHGEMLGERGMWFKQSFYEPSAGVPLLIKLPGMDGNRRVDKLVSLVDLLPTCMDIAGGGSDWQPQCAPIDGSSLLPLMRSQNSAWENQVIAEYTGEGVTAPCRMLRRNNFKFIYTHGHPDLLYDLDMDPLEMNNLIGHAKYADLATEMRTAILRDWEPATIHQACIASQQARLFIQKTTQGNPNWAYQFRPDDTSRFIRNDSAVGIKAKARYPFVEPTPFIK